MNTTKHSYTFNDVIIVNCPLCKSDNREYLGTEYGVLKIVRCRSCSLMYVSPRLKSPEQVYWGNEQEYLNEVKLILEGKESHHRDPNYLEELALIRAYRPSGRFLDVGCNMGLFLRHAKKAGFEVVGVEPSPTASKIAREQLGLTIHQCFLHELPEEEKASFDVIAFSDVFEHITEPLPFLTTAKQYLKPDGVLYVKVPNGQWNLLKQTITASSYTTNPIWDSYEHVVHYTDKTLKKMLESGGFEVLKMSIGMPIQIPVWHEYLGKYYQYPSPAILDWKRYVGRKVFYWASLVQKAILGSCGPFAPSLAVVAKKAEVSAPQKIYPSRA